MSYAYQSFEESKNSDVAISIARKLSELAKTPDHIRVSKIAISDQDDGKARGVIYYWQGDDQPAAVTTNAGSWIYTDFSPDDSDNYDEAYKQVTKFLNDGSISAVQAAAARVGMTNRRHGSFHVTVFYPTQFKPSP